MFIMMYLNQFCCCWSARFGSIIIAWISIIFAASSLLVIVIAFGEEQFIRILLKELERDLEQRYHDGLITLDTYEKTKLFYENIQKAVPYILIIGLILCVFCIIVNLLLLFGVARKQSLLLIPWLIYIIFQLGVQFGYTFGFSIFLMSSGDTEFGLLNLFLSLVITTIGVYFWMIVLSVYKYIRTINVRTLTYGTLTQ